MEYANALARAFGRKFVNKQNERTNRSRRICGFMSIAQRPPGPHTYQRSRSPRTSPGAQELVTPRSNLSSATNHDSPCLLCHFPISIKYCAGAVKKSRKSLQEAPEQHKYYANKRRVASPSCRLGDLVLVNCVSLAADWATPKHTRSPRKPT